SWLDPGDVAVLLRGGVLPQGEAGQALDRERERHALLSRAILEDDLGAAVCVAEELEEVDLLDEGRIRRSVDVPIAHLAFGRASVAREDAAHRSEQLRSLLEKRRAEIRVIEDLHLLRRRAEILDLIVDPERCRSRHGGDLGHEPELRAEHHHLVDDAADDDAPGRRWLDHHLDSTRRDVGGLAVKRELDRNDRARVASHLIDAGGAVRGEAASIDPLAETLEPSEAATAFEVYERGVDDLVDGGVPAELDAPHSPLPKAHSSRRDDLERQHAVVDLASIDAVLLAARDRRFHGVPGMRGLRGG